MNDEKNAKTDVTRLPWGLGVLLEMTNDDVEGYEAPLGTKLAFEGPLEQASYLYIAQIQVVEEAGQKIKLVKVLWPAHGASEQFAPGPSVRVPSGGAWAITDIPGALVRVVASASPATVSDIAKALGGREPPPGTGTKVGG
jgi:hypothetical protein